MEESLQYIGRLEADGGYFSYVCLYRILSASTPLSGGRNGFSSWYREGIIHVGIHLLHSGRKVGGDQSNLLASAVFQVPLAQNNPYAKVACLGVEYSATLQSAKSLRQQPGWGV